MQESESEVTQSCPTLRDPVDFSLPGSSIHGIFQARVLEWGAIAFSDLTAVKRNFSVFVYNGIPVSGQTIRICVNFGLNFFISFIFLIPFIDFFKNPKDALTEKVCQLIHSV